jgi:hypothetical protein
MTLLVMQFSPLKCYFPSLVLKYYPRCSDLRHLSFGVDKVILLGRYKVWRVVNKL